LSKKFGVPPSATITLYQFEVKTLVCKLNDIAAYLSLVGLSC